MILTGEAVLTALCRTFIQRMANIEFIRKPSQRLCRNGLLTVSRCHWLKDHYMAENIAHEIKSSIGICLPPLYTSVPSKLSRVVMVNEPG